MTDRPILFSAPMVRALLAGTKTQTRRTISTKPGKRRPNLFDGTWADDYVRDPALQLVHCHRYAQVGNEDWRQDSLRIKQGDRLWVRESWNWTHTADLAPELRELWRWPA